MRITSLVLLFLSVLVATPARADLHITRDHGGYVEEYKAKYKRIRDRKERVIIDGICNSACTLVFGIVPMNKICVTPKASLGFHQAYYDKAFTFGIKVTSSEGTSDLMSYYPDTVKDWIAATAPPCWLLRLPPATPTRWICSARHAPRCRN